MLAPYQFGFTTPNFNPRVLSSTPSGRFGPPFNVSPTSPIVLNFSEPMNQTATQGAFEVRVGTTLKPGSFTWNAEGTQMTYTPGSSYGFGATVIWKITTAARELSAGRTIGLPLPAEVSGSFTTQLITGR